MKLGEITVEILGEWLNKGIIFSGLDGKDQEMQKAPQKALAVLLISVGFTSFIEFLVLNMAHPRATSDLRLSLLMTGFWHIIHLALWVVLLQFSLWLARARPKFGTVAALTFYSFSGALPLLIIAALFGNQLIIAHQLFLRLGDPTLPYFSGATINLLFPEDPGAARNFSVWFWVAFETAVVVVYFIYNLPRVLLESCSRVLHGANIVCAYVATIVTYTLISYYFLTKYYWTTVRILSR